MGFPKLSRKLLEPRPSLPSFTGLLSKLFATFLRLFEHSASFIGLAKSFFRHPMNDAKHSKSLTEPALSFTKLSMSLAEDSVSLTKLSMSFAEYSARLAKLSMSFRKAWKKLAKLVKRLFSLGSRFAGWIMGCGRHTPPMPRGLDGDPSVLFRLQSPALNLRQPLGSLSGAPH